jgi:hypothetical protein
VALRGPQTHLFKFAQLTVILERPHGAQLHMWISHFLDTCHATDCLLRSSLFRDVTQRWFVVRYRRFGTSWTAWALKIGTVGCPEISVTKYHSKLCNIPKERRPHLNRGGSLKSRMPVFCLKNSAAEFHNKSKSKSNNNNNNNNHGDQIWGSHSGYCDGVFSDVKQTSVVHLHKHFEAQCCLQLWTQQWGVLRTQR